MDTMSSKPPSPSPKVSSRWLPVAIVFILFLLSGAALAFGVSTVRDDSPLSASQPLRLKPAPNFTVPLYSGGEGSFTLSEHKGHPIVINFWASWCPPCRAEFPALQAAATTYAGQGVVVFAVAIQDTEAEAKAFLQEQRTTFLTGPDLDGSIAMDYTITGLPATYFITADGLIYKKWVGEIDEQRLDTFIQELLSL
ncbi:MAG: TlpA family protein disulfide reductase [Chloroflexi bacterium]|nr:TlpA family protein disulfide reductase [Chloroflexota bacterium]